jgi:RNA polymerase sigma-70 factor (ECF subfamily)
MSADLSFRDLIQRVRAGDQQAATELVRNYEEAIAVVVRLRLTDPGLRRLIDSVDISQSVLADLFACLAEGRLDLDQPEQLLRLVTTMVRNKITNHARHQHAARRDLRRLRTGSLKEGDWIDPSPGPSQEAASKELLEKLRNRLSAEEQQLADLRVAGHSWAEIAAIVGGSPDGVRVRLARAVTRVTRTLNLFN